MKRGFASDNNSGISAEIIEMLQEVNKGHEVGYGDDSYTQKAIKLFKKNFGESAISFLTFTGTGANVLALSSVSSSYNSVICAETAHINSDECGAPEKFSGCKLLPIQTTNGKLTPKSIQPYLTGFDFEHHSQPKIISITQPTEMGTLYSFDEILDITGLAHKYKMLVHMDGARLANAAAALNCQFKDLTADLGIDIVSFGGTKNGLMAAESVIFFNEEHARNFKYIRKQGMQLASKMRFISAQFIAYFQNDLWLKNARHANRMAQILADKVTTIDAVKLTQKVEANGIFAIIPKDIIEPLKKEFFFYTWNESTNEVRWMTSFDTTKEDIDLFVDKLTQLLTRIMY